MNKSYLAVLPLALLLTSVVPANAAAIALPVPEAGTTLGLLAIGIITVAGLRRKLGK